MVGALVMRGQGVTLSASTGVRPVCCLLCAGDKRPREERLCERFPLRTQRTH